MSDMPVRTYPKQSAGRRGTPRQRPVHPLFQRCLDRTETGSLREAASKNGVSLHYLCDLAEPERFESYIQKTTRWASALGLSPEEFLEEMIAFISETRAAQKRRGTAKTG